MTTVELLEVKMQEREVLRSKGCNNEKLNEKIRELQKTTNAQKPSGN
jgi:hypothetical protein